MKLETRVNVVLEPFPIDVESATDKSVTLESLGSSTFGAVCAVVSGLVSPLDVGAATLEPLVDMSFRKSLNADMMSLRFFRAWILQDSTVF